MQLLARCSNISKNSWVSFSSLPDNGFNRLRQILRNLLELFEQIFGHEFFTLTSDMSEFDCLKYTLDERNDFFANFFGRSLDSTELLEHINPRNGF